MHRLAAGLTQYLITNEIITDNDKEEYIYGLEVFGLKCINYFSVLILSSILKCFISTVLFMIVFLLLRGRTGGYHADSVIKCYFGTMGIYIFVVKILIPIFILKPDIVFVFFVLAVILILLVAPLNHRNLRLNKEELQFCKKSSRISIVAVSIIVIVLYFFRANMVYIASLVSGVVMDALLLLLQKKEERNEK